MSEFNLENFLRQIIAKKVSDIHFRVDYPPIVRKDGNIMKTNLSEITEKDMSDIISSILPERNLSRLDQTFDLDFLYEVKGLSRFRVNFARNLGRPSLVMRVVPYDIPSYEEMNLPSSLINFTTYNNGIILVTGPTGCGKSTTIATMLEHINKTSQKHVVTIEDPVEFIYTNKKAVFTQRQLGVDTLTFVDGLKHALRQDPDVILIGELRDRETTLNALKAAETGHLVFSTLHTTDAVQTVNRIINMFEPTERDYIKSQLAETLRGTITQKLVRKIDDMGRLPVNEILVVTSTVKDYIIKDKLKDVYDLIKSGNFNDMITMNMSLYQLYADGLISQEEAMSASDDKHELSQLIKGAFYGAK